MASCECSLTGSASEQRGAVCFTFDDYHGENWLKTVPLFKKFNAHATFFISGEIASEKAEVLKKLQDAGHTIGLHTLHHRDALPFIHEQGQEKYLAEEIVPQLEVCRKHGLTIRCFSYPNSRRDETSDQMLLTSYFDYLRTGRKSSEKALYYPLKTLPEKCLLDSSVIGTYYGSELADLKEKITSAAETDSVLVFTSHDLAPAGQIGRIDMSVEWLEELLDHAKQLSLRVVGFDELHALKARKE